MSNDPVLSALALVELVQQLGGTDELAPYPCLVGDTCEHTAINLFLAGMVTEIATKSNYPLAQMIAAEREAALDTGMA